MIYQLQVVGRSSSFPVISAFSLTQHSRVAAFFKLECFHKKLNTFFFLHLFFFFNKTLGPFTHSKTFPHPAHCKRNGEISTIKTTNPSAFFSTHTDRSNFVYNLFAMPA